MLYFAPFSTAGHGGEPKQDIRVQVYFLLQDFAHALLPSVSGQKGQNNPVPVPREVSQEPRT